MINKAAMSPQQRGDLALYDFLYPIDGPIVFDGYGAAPQLQSPPPTTFSVISEYFWSHTEYDWLQSGPYSSWWSEFDSFESRIVQTWYPWGFSQQTLETITSIDTYAAYAPQFSYGWTSYDVTTYESLVSIVYDHGNHQADSFELNSRAFQSLDTSWFSFGPVTETTTYDLRTFEQSLDASGAWGSLHSDEWQWSSSYARSESGPGYSEYSFENTTMSQLTEVIVTQNDPHWLMA